MRALNVLMRHVHGGYMEAFTRGEHQVLLPVTPGDPQGRRREHWPARVREVTPEEAGGHPIDVVIYQSVRDVEEFPRWLGRRKAGIDVPAIYLEHNTPQGRINDMLHPFAGRDDLTLVHVTHFNALFWDCGTTRTVVIEHGVPDPGYRYDGSLPRCAVAINEAVRRARVTGTDLLPIVEREAAPYDLFGIGALDLPQNALYDAFAQRRLYLHPFRWTSLGLTLLEAMHLGMPVVALATTEAPYAVPSDAGIVSNRMDVLLDGIRSLMHDRDAARAMGRRAREHVLAHYSLQRYLDAWNALLYEVTGREVAVL